MSKKEVKKETNKSKVYRLEEMADAIDRSIDNAVKVKGEQQYLVDKLEELKDEKFVELIKSMKEQIVNLNKQIEVLTNRKGLIITVVEKCKYSTEYDMIVNELLDGLGVFDK